MHQAFIISPKPNSRHCLAGDWFWENLCLIDQRSPTRAVRWKERSGKGLSSSKRHHQSSVQGYLLRDVPPAGQSDGAMLRATQPTAGCSHRTQTRERTPRRLAPSPKAVGRGPASPPQAVGQGLAVPPPPGRLGGRRRREGRRPPAAALGGGRTASAGGGAAVPGAGRAVARWWAGPGTRRGSGRPAASRRAGAAAADGCGVVGRSARSACGLPGDICEVACETSAPFRFTLVGGQDNGYAFYWEMQCLSNVIWSLKCGGRARLGCSWKIGVSFPCSYLLLQYGFINTCLKSLVVDKYGEEIWEKLR